MFTAPDYNTIYMFIADLMKSFSTGVDEEIPISLMTSIMYGYPLQIIVEILTKTMTAERMEMLGDNPLDPKEFIPAMVGYIKSRDLCEEYHGWYRKNVPIGVKKALAMETSPHMGVYDKNAAAKARAK